MTMTQQRADIAAAVSLDVDGLVVVGKPDTPDTVSALMAWPVWDSSEPANGCAIVTTWRVLVAMPAADLATSMSAADSLVEALSTALFGLGRVTRVEPILWMSQDTVGVPCVQFTLTI